MKKTFHLQVILVAGIALLAFGLFGYVAWATPQTPILPVGQELGEDNMIAYRQATATCTGNDCGISFGSSPPTPVGRYIGGYLISFRTCQTYSCAGTECTCADASGSTFSSGFGILIYDNATGKVSVLIPLDGQDIQTMGHWPAFMDSEWLNKLLWTEWSIKDTPGEIDGGSFTYDWGGLVGGCGSRSDPCGKVFLEHLIMLRERSN